MANRLKDMIGRKVGRLTIVERGPNSKYGTRWFCRCDCSNPTAVLVSANNLRSANPTKSCGCIAKEQWNNLVTSQDKVIEMMGARSGRLIVVLRGPNKVDGSARWWCRCDCGNPKLTLLSGRDIRAKRTKSCGCLIVEHAKELTSNPTKALSAYWNRPTPMATCHPDRPQEAKGLCGPCYNKLKQTYNPERDKAVARTRNQKPENRYATNGSGAHRRSLKHMYSITPENFADMMVEQDGVCAVCGMAETATWRKTKLVKRLQIDHAHSCCSGKRSCGKCIRGLTCGVCNTILGLSKDKPELLDKLAAYLRAGGHAGVRKIISELP